MNTILGGTMDNRTMDNGRTRFLQGNVALWVRNTQVTTASGRDHRGEFRIGGRGQVKLQHTRGEVDVSASLQARLHDS